MCLHVANCFWTCVCVTCFWIFCWSACVWTWEYVHENMYVCFSGLAYSPAAQQQEHTHKKNEANSRCAVLQVINHAAAVIYVPLLVALSFILRRRISPLHSFGERDEFCLLHAYCFFTLRGPKDLGWEVKQSTCFWNNAKFTGPWHTGLETNKRREGVKCLDARWSDPNSSIRLWNTEGLRYRDGEPHLTEE